MRTIEVRFAPGEIVFYKEGDDLYKGEVACVQAEWDENYDLSVNYDVRLLQDDVIESFEEGDLMSALEGRREIRKEVEKAIEEEIRKQGGEDE
jgi:hypothetical protein